MHSWGFGIKAKWVRLYVGKGGKEGVFLRVDLRSFMTKRSQLAKVQLFRVDLVSRFGVMLQENNGKVGKV